MMKIFKWLFASLILALIVAGVIAWTMPAEVAYRHLAARLGPISLVGVRGTVWDGHADGVSVFGRDLGELDWKIGKVPLLLGSVRADLRIRGADIDTSGMLRRDRDGNLKASDVRFRVPASLFSPALDLPSLRLLGAVSGTLTEVAMVDGVVARASGNARWSDAGVSGSAEARFSDILADFSSSPDGRISGTVADDGKGNLAVEGSFDIAATGFRAEAFLSARNDDPRVQESLRYIGEQQADGSSHLLIDGTLFKVF